MDTVEIYDVSSDTWSIIPLKDKKDDIVFTSSFAVSARMCSSLMFFGMLKNNAINMFHIISLLNNSN